MFTPWRLVAGLASGLVLAACSTSPSVSGSGSASGTATGSSGTASGPAITDATMTWSAAGTFGTEPTVTVPSGTPPTQLLTKDLIVGSGAVAQSGHTVAVQYIGYSWTTKQKFDASWDHNQAFTFALGAGQVIPGWDQGVAGMKVGGRRELVIPPSLAYRSQSPTPAIAANDTLIFVVDLVSVT